MHLLDLVTFRKDGIFYTLIHSYLKKCLASDSSPFSLGVEIYVKPEHPPQVINTCRHDFAIILYLLLSVCVLDCESH